MWCKPGQYLDHKNCVCKNKLIGRLISECTCVVNETMMNNNDSNNDKMDIEPLQMKNKYYYDCDDIIIYDFDFNIDLVKIFKRVSKIGVNIYYIGYKPDIDDTITPLVFFC